MNPQASTPAGDRNLVHRFHAAAAERADAPFLIEPDGTTHTYGEVFDLSARLATVLAGAGAAPGARVLVQVEKSSAAVALYLATLRAGAVHVPLNPAFTAAEVDHYVRDAEPAVVVTDPGAAVTGAAPTGASVLTLDHHGDGSLITAAGGAAPAGITARAGDDLAALLYTSGTTGRPKGAALTHDNLRHNAEALHEVWRFAGDDHLLHTLPLFHVHGLFVALHCALLAAIPVTLLPRFDVDEVLRALPESTVLMGVPTHYGRLLADDRFDGATAAGIRLFTSGSAPLPEAVFEAFEARTGTRICERYGMSEAGIITSNPVDGERIRGTVGFPLPGVELRIVDGDGDPVDPGCTGGVEIRGPSVFAGYWRRPEATEATRRVRGWFVTGDVGSVDDAGRLTLQGRAGDMIISGGENVYPKEIELVLDTVPGVRESAVIGVPHPDFGEGVTAIVVATADFDETTARARLGEELARFKHPKAFVVVDELPRNTMGKVQKHTLRHEHEGLYAG